MNDHVCVNCRNEKPVNTVDNRLVIETCGHVKCMDCLLQEKQGCTACKLGTAPAGDDGCDRQTLHYDCSQKKKVLPAHITVETGDNGKCYVCTVCKKTFHARSQITYHYFCDAKHKLPYKCKFCEKRFAVLPHYMYHMSVHSGEKPHACDVCGLAFFQMSKLQRHKLKHTGEKRYPCEACGKALGSGEALRKHRRTHSGERPYACGLCARRFADSSNLRQHVRLRHAKKTRCEVGGERRRHACSRCQRVFTKPKDLLRHAAVHSDQSPFSCSVCVRAFKRKDNLERHIRNAHPELGTIEGAVCVDADALSAHRALLPVGPPPALAETLERLNPLPPLDRDLIRQHMTDDAASYSKCILEANTARESVIFPPPNRTKKERSPRPEYVHKIRKAHCMVAQKDLHLPPIDEKKIIELERKTDLNKLDVGSPPKNVDVYKKILLEAPAHDEPTPPPRHWRAKMKLNAHW